MQHPWYGSSCRLKHVQAKNSRKHKLTALICNISLIGLLFIRTVDLTGLFPFQKINFCPCQTGWRSECMHYLVDVASYFYKHDRNVWFSGSKNHYQIRAVYLIGLLGNRAVNNIIDLEQVPSFCAPFMCLVLSKGGSDPPIFLPWKT